MAEVAYDDAMKLAIARSRARARVSQESFWDFIKRVNIRDEANRRETPYELWPHIETRFESWLEGNSEVILKARQEGFSWALAAYAAYTVRQPYTQVLMLSSGEFYSKKLLEKVDYILRSANVPISSQNAGEINVRGGGTIYALPSTEQAGRSLTASVVIVDEAAFHPWADENAKAYMPTVLDGTGQVIICSTSNGASGFFYDTWTHAKDKGFVQVFEPWWVRPGRDDAWAARARAMMTKEDFKREYPATPEEAFELAKGLVYGDSFSYDKHVRPGPPPVPWSACVYTYSSMDLGGGDPTAVILLGVYKDAQGQYHAHIYDLYYRVEGAPTVDEIYAAIAPWWPTKTVCDPAPLGETIANSLEAMGLTTEMANNQRGKGIDVVKLFLQKDWLTIAEECSEQIVREFRSYHYLERRDQKTNERYATSTPADHHGDILDALRYCLMTVYVDIWNAEGGSRPYSGVQW